MEPIKEPVITHLLAKKMHEKSQTPKPTALGTPLRYSSSFGCARQQGYYAFDAEPTEPMDEAGAWVTGIGTIVHEALQEAILEVFPNALFEVPSGTEYISGSCDALIPVSDLGIKVPGTHVLWELKTMGTFGFDKQVGWNRMRGDWKYPEGPAKKAVVQAGMNALGIMAANPEIVIEKIVMGSTTFEALSINKAEKMGVEKYNRFMAEFWIDRSQWEQDALDEIRRSEGIFSALTAGYLPDRIALDDNGSALRLDPNSSKFWQCDYCSFKTVCLQDGDGQVWINESNLERRNKD